MGSEFRVSSFGRLAAGRPPSGDVAFGGVPWPLPFGLWALAFALCTLHSAFPSPLRIGLAPSADKVRLTCQEGMTVSGEGLGMRSEVLLESGQWLLVGPGRAQVITHTTAFSLISAEADRDLIAKTAERLRKEGHTAYLEERNSITRLRIMGLPGQTQAQRLKDTLPAQLRQGAEILIERNWALSGNLALGEAEVNIRPNGGSGREGSSDPSAALWVAWVATKGPFPEAAHGAYRDEMAILQVQGKVGLVNLVEMEDYLKGVVPYEMPWRFAPEALKAQAIAARTYALCNLNRHRKDGFDLCAGQHCQVYGGVEAERATTSSAVEQTDGLVMTTEKGLASSSSLGLVPAFFHSTCGGHTEDASSAWKGTGPLVKGVWDLAAAASPAQALEKEEEAIRFLKEPPDAFCGHSPLFRWQRTYSRQELETRLGKELGEVVGILVKARTAAGRVSKLLIKGSQSERLLEGQEIRFFFGEQPWKGLPSSFFFVTEMPPSQGETSGAPQGFTFTGAGWGHGVGMCQYGADGMARRGHDFMSILTHYYGQFALRQMKEM